MPSTPECSSTCPISSLSASAGAWCALESLDCKASIRSRAVLLNHAVVRNEDDCRVPTSPQPLQLLFHVATRVIVAQLAAPNYEKLWGDERHGYEFLG
jgi:hypothetical protein